MKGFWRFSTLIPKLYALHELFPFKTGKMVIFHAKLNENNTYFPHNLFEKSILQFDVLSIALDR